MRINARLGDGTMSEIGSTIGYRCATLGLVLAVQASMSSAANLQVVGTSTEPTARAVKDPNRAASDAASEIVVTARKRSESLIDVPIAVTAASGAELTKRGITTVNDLVQLVPGMQISSNQGRTAVNVTIRGVGLANQFSANAAGPVGIYSDEVFQSYRPALGIQQFDLARVEVLRGPQGTLFGHNTTGGSVNFVSVAPKLNEDANGYATIGYGNRNRVTLEGASDVTLIPDKLGVRVAAQYERADGFLHNVLPGGEDGGKLNSLSGRMLIRAKPTPSLDATLKIYGGRTRDTAAHMTFGTIGAGEVNRVGYSRLGLGKFEIETPVREPINTNTFGVGLNLKWNDGGAVTLTSITQYDKGSNLNDVDCDTSPQDLCQTEFDTKGRQFNQDVRLNYDRGKVHAVIGALYSWDKLNFLQLVHFNNGAQFDIRDIYTQTRSSEAGYAEVAYALNDALSITGGARYTFDQNTLSNTQASLTSGYRGPSIISTVPGPFGSPFDPSAFLPTMKRPTKGFTGRAILQYKMSHSEMVYASYSRGYRSGNFSGSQFFSPAEANFVQPENVNTYELGFKGEFFRRALNVELASYYNDLRNQQVASQIVGSNGTFVPGLSSLNGHSYGIEIEAGLRVSQSLRLTGNASIMRTRFDSNQVINGVTPVGGNRFALAPNFTALGLFDWTAWHSDRQSIVLTASANYMGQYFYDPQNGKAGGGRTFVNGQHSYTLVDARLSYNLPRVSISVWGKNLTNKLYLPFNAVSGGYDSAAPAMSRTYGFQATAKF